MANVATKNIKSNNSTYYPLRAWAVCITASLFFFYEFIQMMMFNAIEPNLTKAFHVTPAELGNLSAMYFYANAIFLFPAAILLDRMQTKKLILLAMLMCTASVYGFAVSQSLLFSEICRFCEGIGGAFVMLSCVRLASRWFPANKLALAVGVIVTMAMLGGVVAQTPLIYLKEHVGWRTALVYDAGLGLLITALIILVVKNYPPGYHKRKEQQNKHIRRLGLWRSFKISWGNFRNWLCAIYAASLNLPIYLLGAIWGISYLTNVHGFTPAQASYCTSLLFIGSIFGSPIIGWASDRFARRRLPMFLSATICLALILTIMFAPGISTITMAILFLLLGFFTSSQVLSYPLVSELNPISLTSTSVSIVSLVLMLSGAIGQPLFGWLMTHGNDYSHIPHHPAVATVKDYSLAMDLMPLMFIISIIVLFFVPETRCKPLKNKVLARD